MADLPRITIVTPSYNQAEFLERTIRSVLDQGYPNLEYIIVDGGSTDGSVEIIRRYADRLTWWVSEPDRGQSHAINKGLRRATGEWVAWQNSDDIYYPGAFHDLARAAANNPRAELIIGDMMLIDAQDQPLRDICYVKPSYRALLAEGMVLANQSAFWRRCIHERVGWLDETLHYAFDYDWFLRLTRHARSVHVPRIWGAFRLHGAAKTGSQGARFLEENDRIRAGHKIYRWQKPLYSLRRAFLMGVEGQFGYLLRGIWRRLKGRQGGLY